jgi:hypothetical protein
MRGIRLEVPGWDGSGQQYKAKPAVGSAGATWLPPYKPPAQAGGCVIPLLPTTAAESLPV